MPSIDSNALQQKISTVFQSRLARLKNAEKTHAIVLLETKAAGDGRRQSATGRRQTITKVQQAAEKSLSQIDAILTRYDGRRLTDHASVLGTIPVETTRSGIYALANLPNVKAIMEDQSISSL